MHSTSICGTFQAITAQNHQTSQPATNNNKAVSEVVQPTHQDIDLSKGLARAEFLRQKCQSSKGFKRSISVRVSLDEHYRLLFCPMCKMASTFWTRVFKMLKKNRQTDGKTLLTPYDVPISQAPPAHTIVKLKASDNYHSAEVDGFFKFLFIRDPYSKIFSAFVDKIVGPNPYFWKYYGINAISRFRKDRSEKCGSDVRFDEFVKYIVHMYKTRNSLECHVDTFDICGPCEMNYTYIGKMETFKEDTYAILSHLKQEATIEVFRINFTDFHADDAIEDSVRGPYSWKKQIMHCITWHEALQRIWKKLKFRGIIGRTPFPLGNSQAESISERDFIKLLKDVRRQTTSAERRVQTKEAFSEAFGSVPLETLYQIKDIYKKEFEFFDYENMPDKIFSRNASSVNGGGHWFS